MERSLSEFISNKEFKSLAIPNIYSCSYQSLQPTSNNISNIITNNYISNNLVDTLIDLASSNNIKHKKTRKNKNNLKKNTKLSCKNKHN